MNGPFKFGEIRPIQYFLGVGVIIGLLFSMIADGDETVSAIFPQVLQWQLQVLIPLFILIALHTLLHKYPKFDALNPWLKLFISGVVGALIFTPMAMWIDGIYGESTKIKLGSAYIHEFSSVAPPIICSWVAMNAPWLLGFQLVRNYQEVVENDTAQVQTTQLAQPEFYQLLPFELRGDLVYLKAELHYLKVVTSKGSSLILFNLKDAIEQISQTVGISTHRSYWVAKNAIKEFVKQGRQGKVICTTGDEIPVSRSQLQAVSHFL